MEVAREANRPLTAKELGEQLILRKFPTTSTNITNLVQTRLTDLVKRGVFRRAEGQPSVVLAKSGDEKKASTTKAHSNGKATPAKKKTGPGPRKGQPSLRSLLTELLQKSRKPVPARDLAEQEDGDGLHDYEQELHRRGLDGTGPDEGRERQQRKGCLKKG